jgi:ubiquinone/menaquinone biosynthesis C-methylase UbiE
MVTVGTRIPARRDHLQQPIENRGASMNVRTDAYTGLAQKYRESRPTYPAELVRLVADSAGTALGQPAPLLVDVGCGTGISTLALIEMLPETCRVIGVEPNADMRAEAARAAPAGRDVSFVAGSAQAIPVGDSSAALVTAAQAIHWFDRPAFYAEAARALGPGGALAVFENNRNWRRSALLDQHEAFLEAHALEKSGTPYSRSYRDHPYAQELFRAFGNVRAEKFEWVRRVPVETFLTMTESSTVVQSALARTGHQEGLEMMRAYSERHADQDGLLSIPYIAEVYLVRRI